MSNKVDGHLPANAELTTECRDSSRIKMTSNPRMDTIGPDQKVSLLSATVGKLGNDCRVIGFLDINAFRVVLNFDAPLVRDFDQSLPDDTSRDAEGFIAIILLAAIQYGADVADIPGRQELELFIIPPSFGKPVVHTNPIESSKGIGCECNEASVKRSLVAKVKDFARDILLMKSKC